MIGCQQSHENKIIVEKFSKEIHSLNLLWLKIKYLTRHVEYELFIKMQTGINMGDARPARTKH